VTDGAPALALGLDPADPDVMQQPPRPQGSGAITREMWLGILVVGSIMAVGTLLIVDAALPGGLIPGSRDMPYGRTMAFTTLMLCQMFNVFNARSDTHSAFYELFYNRWLWGAVALSILLQLAVIYVPLLQRAFDTVPLQASDWLQCVLVASSVLWLRELTKVVRRSLRRSNADLRSLTTRAGGNRAS
jgi:P-type Ca2+ transporter type 2C